MKQQPALMFGHEQIPHKIYVYVKLENVIFALNNILKATSRKL